MTVALLTRGAGMTERSHDHAENGSSERSDGADGDDDVDDAGDDDDGDFATERNATCQGPSEKGPRPAPQRTSRRIQ
eukprot:6509029-Pyramimonas_sp.AAC.1